MVPCGRRQTSSPPSSATAACSNDSWPPLARSTGMPPSAVAIAPSTGTSKISFLPRPRAVRPVAAQQLDDRLEVEVGAVVADEDRRAGARDVLGARRCRSARTGVSSGGLARKSRRCSSMPSDGHLEHTRRDVEVHDRPAPGDGVDGEPRVGVHGGRAADGRQQRQVVDRVGVGEALGEVDVLAGRPLLDRRELAARPDEVARDRAVEPAVLVDRVARGDDVVEAQLVGERLDEVVRRRRREHDRPAGRVVLLDERERERVDDGRDRLGGGQRRGVEGGTVAALGEQGRLAGQEDRGEGLADQVEHPVEQALAGQLAGDDPEVVHRPREQRAGAALEQGAVEVEDRRAGHGGRLPGRGPDRARTVEADGIH